MSNNQQSSTREHLSTHQRVYAAISFSAEPDEYALQKRNDAAYLIEAEVKQHYSRLDSEMADMVLKLEDDDGLVDTLCRLCGSVMSICSIIREPGICDNCYQHVSIETIMHNINL